MERSESRKRRVRSLGRDIDDASQMWWKEVRNSRESSVMQCTALNSFFLSFFNLLVLDFGSYIMCFILIINDCCRQSMISRRVDSGCACHHPHMVRTGWHVQIDMDKHDDFISNTLLQYAHTHTHTHTLTYTHTNNSCRSCSIILWTYVRAWAIDILRLGACLRLLQRARGCRSIHY